MNGLSLRLAEHVAGPIDLPADAVEAAKRSLLDAIAVSIGGAGEAGVDAFVALAQRNGGVGSCDIFGHNTPVSTEMAAFANGAMAHALDYEDALDGAPLHPNAALTPAVLAMAQARGGVSGRALIEALAVGCDLSCRLALSLRTPMERGGWYPPPILGAFGAVAGAARVAQLDVRVVLDAFSLMLSQTACSGEIKHAEGAAIRAVRDAFPARAAVTAVELAHAHVRGFDAPFEGASGFFRLFAQGDYDPDILLSDLGATFAGASLSYKPWPSCRGTHAFIEAALDLRQRHDLSPAQISTIVLRGHPIQQMLATPLETKRAPRTAIDAKFSLPYTSANAFVRGAVGLHDFSAAALQNADVVALAARVSFEVDTSITSSAAGRMIVHLQNGEMLERSVDAPLGSPSAPLSWDDLVTKAVDCAVYAGMPDARARMVTLAATIRDIEHESDAANAIFKAIRPG